MANEVTVWEQTGIRGTPIRQAPAVAVQTLSIGGAVSATFNKSTRIISIRTTTDCHIEFSALDGTAPNGAGAGSGVLPLLNADGWLDVEVRGGKDKVIVVA